MIIDGLSPPIGLKTLNALIVDGKMHLNGTFESGLTQPMLLWPKNNPWQNPCKDAKNLCCLREVNDKYRNDLLQSIQQDVCLTELPNDMITSSRSGVTSTQNSFHAVVPSETPFLAMLFIQKDPFLIFEGFQKITVLETKEASTTFQVQNNPCYSVAVPGTMMSVCMQCNNKLPSNAYFVWTPNWYVNFQCSWECQHNYLKADNKCSISESNIPLKYVVLGGVSAAVILILCIFCNTRRRHKKSEQRETDTLKHAEIDAPYITFKDDIVFDSSRIKLL